MNFIKRINFFTVSILYLTAALISTLTAQEKETILFFGDSITAGYGLSEEQAYPALIEQKIDSLGLSYDVVNAGLSGETTAGGARRVDWILQQDIALFVLGLGGNDGLRGIDPSNTKQNLQTIIDKVHEQKPSVTIILAGMEAPPNLGEAYTTKFRQVFADLAEENQVTFMPFLLEDVAGIRELNQPDGIHPTAEGQKIIAENLWEILRPQLEDVEQ